MIAGAGAESVAGYCRPLLRFIITHRYYFCVYKFCILYPYYIKKQDHFDPVHILWCLRGYECEPLALFSLLNTTLKEILLIQVHNNMKTINCNTGLQSFFMLRKRS